MDIIVLLPQVIYIILDNLGIGKLLEQDVPEGAGRLADNNVHIVVQLLKDSAVHTALKEVQEVVKVLFIVLLKIMKILVPKLSESKCQ